MLPGRHAQRQQLTCTGECSGWFELSPLTPTRMDATHARMPMDGHDPSPLRGQRSALVYRATTPYQGTGLGRAEQKSIEVRKSGTVCKGRPRISSWVNGTNNQPRKSRGMCLWCRVTPLGPELTYGFENTRHRHHYKSRLAERVGNISHGQGFPKDRH